MLLLLSSMMTLITGFTCPPTIYFKFITKCDKCYYKVRQLFLLQSTMVCYYKVRQLFYYKVRQGLLQSATGITKCDQFLQSATGITKCDDYYKVRQNIRVLFCQPLVLFFKREAVSCSVRRLVCDKCLGVHTFQRISQCFYQL